MILFGKVIALEFNVSEAGIILKAVNYVSISD